MSGLLLLAEKTAEAPVCNKRQREGASCQVSGTSKPGESNTLSMLQRNLLTLQAETNAQLQALLNERSAVLQKQRDLLITASAAVADAVAPPIPKAFNRDSRSVLRRIFGEHEQNGVVNQQQLRSVPRLASFFGLGDSSM
jgi:hypothetical protein